MILQKTKRRLLALQMRDFLADLGLPDNVYSCTINYDADNPHTIEVEYFTPLDAIDVKRIKERLKQHVKDV